MDGTTNQTGQQGFQPGQGNFAGRPPGMGGRFGGRGGFLFFGPYGTWISMGLLVITYVILAIAFYQFLKKSGLTPIVAVLMLVPVVNLGVALWAAFAEWPVLKELERLKMVVASAQAVGAVPAPVTAATDPADPGEPGAPDGPSVV